MYCQMMRVISSPSSSTTGFATLILAISAMVFPDPFRKCCLWQRQRDREHRGAEHREGQHIGSFSAGRQHAGEAVRQDEAGPPPPPPGAAPPGGTAGPAGPAPPGQEQPPRGPPRPAPAE